MVLLRHFKDTIRIGNIVQVVDLETGALMDVKVSKAYLTGEIYFYGFCEGKQVVFHWSDDGQVFQGGKKEDGW